MREAITREADRHEEYGEAEWAMASDDVALLRAVADDLTPDNDARRFSNLVDWRPRIRNFKWGEDGYDVELARSQNEALEVVLALGADALAALTVEVKTPDVIGHMLSTMIEAPEEAILAWLSSQEQNLRRAALAFASDKINVEGFSWLRDTLEPCTERGVTTGNTHGGRALREAILDRNCHLRKGLKPRIGSGPNIGTSPSRSEQKLLACSSIMIAPGKP